MVTFTLSSKVGMMLWGKDLRPYKTASITPELTSETPAMADELHQVYLMVTQDSDVVESFGEALRRYGDVQGGEIMTYAGQLLAEGEAKGRVEGRAEGEQRGKVEVVEGLLRVGVSWEVIEAATGLNASEFQALKERLASGS